MIRETVVITGAEHGLGAYLTDKFLREGHRCVVNTHYNPKKQSKEAGIRRVVVGDITKPEVRAALTTVAIEEGATILINNAGIYHSTQANDMSAETVARVLEINFVAHMMLTISLWPTFTQNGGTVVFINSLAGKEGSEHELLYSASKHALSGFAKSLGFRAVRNKISILSVYLGAMQTNMTVSRQDYNKLISPIEAADAIYNACANYHTMTISEMTLRRRLY